MTNEGDGRVGPLLLDRHQDDGDFLMGLGVACGDAVNQPRRVKAEIIIETHADRDRRLRRNVAVGLWFLDDDARCLILEVRTS